MTLPFRPVLDHHPGPEHRDERNKDYGVRRLVDAVPTGNVWWTPGPNLLNQRETGHCGGFAAANEAQASPIRVPKVNDDYAHAYYYEIKSRKLDPWGLEDGTSTQAVMNLGRLRGLWGGYAWAFNFDDLRRALQVGPVLCGTVWRTRMFEPSIDGLIRATGADEGGHLWLVTGYTKDYLGYGPCIRIRNSWGPWGRNGSAYLPWEDAATVIFDDDGECAVPVNRAFPAA